MLGFVSIFVVFGGVVFFGYEVLYGVFGGFCEYWVDVEYLVLGVEFEIGFLEMCVVEKDFLMMCVFEDLWIFEKECGYVVMLFV